jgi:hypothetical protein
MPGGRKRMSLLGRIDIETWNPDLDKIKEQLAPAFAHKPSREKPKEFGTWPKQE